MSSRELLGEKARQISESCKNANLPEPQIRITTDNSVDLTWQYEGTRHTLSLYYSSKNKRWTPQPKTEWLKQMVSPVIMALFEPQTLSQPSLAIASPTLPVKGLTLQTYFAEALACVALLEPYAHENVDCSIICRKAKEAVQALLNESVFSNLDYSALKDMLVQPDVTGFSVAKEFLTRCMTLCNPINKAAN